MACINLQYIYKTGYFEAVISSGIDLTKVQLGLKPLPNQISLYMDLILKIGIYLALYISKI